MTKRIAIIAFLFLLVVICSAANANAQVSQPKKYVAFRDDDIQPFVSLATLEAVNQVHIDENVPVTLGIIPHPRPGQEGNQLLQDDQFLTYMRSIASNPLFEFAQHGYTHTRDSQSGPPSEFKGHDYRREHVPCRAERNAGA